MTTLSKTPSPPYYAVIFSSIRTTLNDGYDTTANRMLELASQQPGFLGADSAREDIGITVSYWKDLASIQNWKNQTEHVQAQKNGQERWYAEYNIKIAKVERSYGFEIHSSLE